MISIITVTYNNIEGLKKTIPSVVCQEFRNFELIVIDNKSLDGSLEYLKSQEDLLPKLIIVSEEDQGIYYAMNKGIQRASFEYLLFLNAGDRLYSSDTLKEVFGRTKRKPDMIYGDYISEEKNRYKSAKDSKYINYGMFTSHQAMYFKSSILKENRLSYNTKFKIGADYLFVFEFLKYAEKLECITRPLCFFETPITSAFSFTSLIEHHQIRREFFNNSIIMDLFITVLHLIKNLLIKFLL